MLAWMGSAVSLPSKLIEDDHALDALFTTPSESKMDAQMDVNTNTKEDVKHLMSSPSASAPPLPAPWAEQHQHQQERAVASSPAPAQHTTDLKRPLSPFSAAIADAQASKRARGEAQGPVCLHCGCDSHRWTACMSRCDHCGARHMGKRCPQLDVDAYKPGGFLQNKHYRPSVPDEPPLALTPVDAAMPDYIIARDGHDSDKASTPSHSGDTARDAGSSGHRAVVPSIKTEPVEPGRDSSKMPPPAVPAFGGYTGLTPATKNPTPTASTSAVPGASLSMMSGDETRSAQVAPATGIVKPSSVSSQPVSQMRAVGDSKMDAGRAALIALTPAVDLKPTSAPKLIEGGGPRSSGENNTPLGQRKPSAFATPARFGGGTQPANGASAQRWLNPTVSASPAPAHGRSGSMTSSVNNTAAVNAGNAEVNAHRATANLQKTLDDARKAAFLALKTFGGQNNASQGVASAPSSNATRGTGNAFNPPTSAPPTFSFSMSTNGNSNATRAQLKAPSKEVQTWRTVEGQIRAAVESTKRAGKCCNGKNKHVDDNANVNYAMDILRHVILGGPHVDMNSVPMPEPPVQPAPMIPMPQPYGGYPAQPPGPQGPPPPPPGMMVWDWASGSWQWNLHMW